MRKVNVLVRLMVVVIPAFVLVGFTQVDIKSLFADVLNRFNVVTGFVKDDGKSSLSFENIINSYMPVVGFVESNYVETEYVEAPHYHQNEDVVYIDLENQSPVQTEAGENTLQPDNTLSVENAVTQSVETPVMVGKFNKTELLDFNSLLNRFYTVTSITELTENKFNVGQALDADMTIKQDNTTPQILIFHTHSQEDFVDSQEGDANTTIVGVGARLAQILSSQYGYNVIHDTSVYDYVNGVLDRSKAYTYAEQNVEKILEQYPTIEVVLDVHRDGVAESMHLVTDVNGKPTARVMFFNGISYTKVNGDIDYLQNPHIQGNLAMSLQMHLLGESYYPGWLRKNYIHGYRYCLHFREKSMLIEVGAQNNTLEEELNAMEPLAATLDRMFRGEKAYQ